MTRRQRHEDDDDHKHLVLVSVIVSFLVTAINIEGNRKRQEDKQDSFRTVKHEAEQPWRGQQA